MEARERQRVRDVWRRGEQNRRQTGRDRDSQRYRRIGTGTETKREREREREDWGAGGLSEQTMEAENFVKTDSGSKRCRSQEGQTADPQPAATRPATPAHSQPGPVAEPSPRSLLECHRLKPWPSPRAGGLPSPFLVLAQWTGWHSLSQGTVKSEGLDSHPGLGGQARKPAGSRWARGCSRVASWSHQAPNTSHAGHPSTAPKAAMAQTQLGGQERRVEAQDGVTGQSEAQTWGSPSCYSGQGACSHLHSRCDTHV